MKRSSAQNPSARDSVQGWSARAPSCQDANAGVRCHPRHLSAEFVINQAQRPPSWSPAREPNRIVTIESRVACGLRLIVSDWRCCASQRRGVRRTPTSQQAVCPRTKTARQRKKPGNFVRRNRPGSVGIQPRGGRHVLSALLLRETGRVD